MKTHEIKCSPDFFNDVAKGIKSFEVRLNDRDYEVGDLLVIREYRNGEYTGLETRKTVVYFFDNDAMTSPRPLHEDWCILGLAKYEEPN